jgi:hypothetical protein
MTADAISPDRSMTGLLSTPARLLQLDGALCAAMGAAMAVAAGPVSDLLGTDATGVVRAVGIALVAYAVALFASARGRWSRPVLAGGRRRQHRVGAREAWRWPHSRT